MKTKLLLGILLLNKVLFGQCSGFPSTIAEVDCSLFPALVNNAHITATDTLSFCATGTSVETFSGINLDGGVIRVCGNAVITGNLNSGSIVVQCGASLTFGSGLVLNNNTKIINYGNVLINGDLTFQNNNNAFYNEGLDSRLIVTGNISYPQNAGQSAYFKNEGFVEIGGIFRAWDGGHTCLSDGSRLTCNNLEYIRNCGGPSNRFTFSSGSGSAIIRYATDADIRANFTMSSNIQVHQAAASTLNLNGCGSFGAATIVPNAPIITDPGPTSNFCSISCLTTLPVGLADFNVEYDGEYVDFTWTTITETNNDYFTVETSTDGENWTELTTVQGAGNSSEPLNYSIHYLDRLTEAIHYYRLKQTDFNGAFSYSEIESIKIDMEKDFSVYPNPFVGELNILLPLEKAGNAVISIYDLKGISVYENTVQTSGLIFLDKNIETLEPGTYIICIRIDGDIYVKRIVRLER